VPVQKFSTLRGTLLVSSPEATALDLVGYAHHAGGLSQVRRFCLNSPRGSIQRNLPPLPGQHPSPGRNGSDTCWSILAPPQKRRHSKEYVREEAKQSTALLPKARRARSRRNKGWKLYINA